MQVVAFGDIHGNLPALEAVLAEIRKMRPSVILCHGDLSLGGPWSRECAELIRTESLLVTKGNTDDLVAGDREPASLSRVSPPHDVVEMAANIRASMGSELLTWMRSRPTKCEFRFPLELILTHATRVSIFGRIPTRDAPESEWLSAFGPAPATVVCGHSHQTFNLTFPSGLSVINTGSVGLPRDGDGRASFLVITQHHGKWGFSHRRIEYDRETTAQTFLTQGGERSASSARAILYGAR